MRKKKPGKRRIRNPRQQRGINQKEQIIQAAYTFICKYGYSKFTTPKLAKAAGISVGSIYGYFKDKNDIFQSVLDLNSKKFDAMREAAFLQFQKSKEPLQKQLYDFLVALLAIHEASRELHVEMKQLSFRDQSMKSRMDNIDQKVHGAIIEWLLLHKKELSIIDMEACALLMMDFVNALVDRIVFGKLLIPRDRLLLEGVHSLVSIIGIRNVEMTE
jgi:AcrR family transcriptional regulator